MPHLAELPKIFDMVNFYDKIYTLTEDPEKMEDYIINVLDEDLNIEKVWNKVPTDGNDLECKLMVPAMKELDLAFFNVLCWSYRRRMYVSKIVYASDGEQISEEKSNVYLASVPEDTIKKGEYYYFHDALFVNSKGAETAIYIFDLFHTAIGFDEHG